MPCKCGQSFLYANQMCRKCYTKDLYERKPEAKKRRLIKARKTDKSRWQSLTVKERYQRNRVNRLRRYGLTPEMFEAMLREQGGLCPICLKEPKMLCIDHDHKTDKVRGLLCRRCNYGIAWFSDDIQQLKRAAHYLEMFQQEAA